MQKLMLVTIAAAAALSVQMPASAGEIVSGRVSYADLDLSTESGAAALEARVNAEVMRLCPPGINIPIGYNAGRCRADARKDVEPAVRTAIADARNHEDVQLAEGPR